MRRQLINCLWQQGSQRTGRTIYIGAGFIRQRLKLNQTGRILNLAAINSLVTAADNPAIQHLPDSTLLKLLQQHFNAALLLHPVPDNHQLLHLIALPAAIAFIRNTTKSSSKPVIPFAD